MTDYQPEIDVIMIVYNGADLIAESIESVCQQTHNNWMLTIVDDGSTDNTLDVVNNFVQRDPRRIRLIQHPDKKNHGMSKSRLRGAQSTSGPLLIFLDHDDLLTPTALEEMALIMEHHPDADATFGPNLRFWTSDEGKPLEHEPETQDLRTDLDRTVKPPGILPTMIRNAACSPLAPMIRRPAYELIGGHESSFRRMYEDQAFLTKLFLHSPIYISGKTWVHYRQHGSSCVWQSFRNKTNAKGRRIYLKWALKYLEEKKINNPQVYEFLTSELKLTRQSRFQEIKQKPTYFIRKLLSSPS